ncbi:MAG TPA: protein-glutamate O-methyltransferase CheR [Caulobacteraceae bacterium]|jgi:chemotaxis protein methyltransferase CheR|nr:protein-glutamate O-methyltransferase CheR [Caulobacteraceae bacterium]
MKAEDIEVVRGVVLSRSGVVIDPTKTYLIESRLAPLARREGFASQADLIQAIRARRDDKLMWAVTEALTSSETCFFRDRAPFDQFRDEILPELADRRGDQPIRVWSAACSTGQEPYSLAMIVDAERSNLPGARIELFASDLSERCLEKAQSGLYTQFEVQRGLPIHLLVRHFEQIEELWALSPRVRQMVRWRRVNLLADLRALGLFDVIFCRNIISAFDDVIRRRVLEQLAQALPEDGRLVLGMDETVIGVTEALQPVPGSRGVYSPNPEYQRAA